MENRSSKLFNSLKKYYLNLDHLYTVYEILHKDEIDCSCSVSLRVIDWLVTNYSKSFNVVYMVNKKPFYLHQSYKNMLKAYSKRMFDPFRRHDRVFIECPFHISNKMETTVAQLMFFKWCIEYNVLDYALKYKDTIKNNMDKNTKHRNKKNSVNLQKKKRSELIKLNTPTHIYHNIKTNFTFS